MRRVKVQDLKPGDVVIGFYGHLFGNDEEHTVASVQVIGDNYEVVDTEGVSATGPSGIPEDRICLLR
jgi:hypothetical protein